MCTQANLIQRHLWIEYGLVSLLKCSRAPHWIKNEFYSEFRMRGSLAIHNTNKQWIKTMPAFSISLKNQKEMCHDDIWNIHTHNIIKHLRPLPFQASFTQHFCRIHKIPPRQRSMAMNNIFNTSSSSASE